jgi:hypothetical protein
MPADATLATIRLSVDYFLTLQQAHLDNRFLL